jgi:thioredoxin 1
MVWWINTFKMAVITSNDQSFRKDLENNSKVVVKYYADWCGSCKLFSPKYRRLSEDERFKDIVFLDVDAEHNPAARKMGQVATLPFFATFRDGALVETDSTTKEEVFISLLEKL